MGVRRREMTFGKQNTENEAHAMLCYAFESGINALDTAELQHCVRASVYRRHWLVIAGSCHCLPDELLAAASCVRASHRPFNVAIVYWTIIFVVLTASSSAHHCVLYPVPPSKETQGRTDLYIGSWLKSQPRDKVIVATKVAGYSEQSTYLRQNAKVVRVDAANIKESVENSLKRLNIDYIDLLQIHWPDRCVPLFGEFFYDPSKWRPSVPFVEQLEAFQELIDEGKNEGGYGVRYIGVSNETSYGVMEFVHAAKDGLPKIVSIQNNYSLLVRCHFEIDLVEVCHPNNYNIGLLAYSPLAGGALTGKYLDIDSYAAKKGRFNLFPGYMERYNRSLAKEVTSKYIQLAKEHGLTPVELALGFTRDRSFVTSSIIGATSVDQLKVDIDAYLNTKRPLPPEVTSGIEEIFNTYKDPAVR
ncbi:hypothetical protein Syun_006668 [Stephania yunnanensis]|uniref:NADP-dependent oxidoreductase domain-containing protein n=1 Tax=Stephania yunnanensis TaxID=152371 RepID=A0AAP0PXS2_9MAGN